MACHSYFKKSILAVQADFLNANNLCKTWKQLILKGIDLSLLACCYTTLFFLNCFLNYRWFRDKREFTGWRCAIYDLDDELYFDGGGRLNVIDTS